MTPKIKCICSVCKDNFIGTNKKSKYCDRCKKTEKSCVVCDETFIWESKASGRITCSKECYEIRRDLDRKIGRFIIFERDSFRCSYCGRDSIEDNIKLVIDHIYPKSKGGKDIASNLITTCNECNLTKRNIIIKSHNLIKISKEVSIRNKNSEINPDKIIKL